MTLNGYTIDWHEETDLPDYCGACPFWWGAGSSSVPGITNSSTVGICNLREMNKDRYADTPQACRRLFRKCFKFPDNTQLVITIKD